MTLCREINEHCHSENLRYLGVRGPVYTNGDKFENTLPGLALKRRLRTLQTGALKMLSIRPRPHLSGLKRSSFSFILVIMDGAFQQTTTVAGGGGGGN